MSWLEDSILAWSLTGYAFFLIGYGWFGCIGMVELFE